LITGNLTLFLLICRCFKREFTEAVAIKIWEACWSNYLTDYFHLFVCLAIISVYADDVIAQNLRTDEMLLHFSSLGKPHINERIFSEKTLIDRFPLLFHTSYVYGRAINFAQGSRTAAPI
jgi:hypothetical protein